MLLTMKALGHQVQLDRRSLFCALGSFAAIAVVLKKTLFRGRKSGDTQPTVCEV